MERQSIRLFKLCVCLGVNQSNRIESNWQSKCIKSIKLIKVVKMQYFCSATHTWNYCWQLFLLATHKQKCWMPNRTLAFCKHYLLMHKLARYIDVCCADLNVVASIGNIMMTITNTMLFAYKSNDWLILMISYCATMKIKSMVNIRWDNNAIAERFLSQN